MKNYNIEYVIETLTKEEDRLFEKINSSLSGELLNDFETYEAIRTSLIVFREDLNKLK